MTRAETQLQLSWLLLRPLLAALLWPAVCPAWSAETNQQPAIFHVGMAKLCFRNVNRNDAVAAYRGFLESAGRRFGNVYTADPVVYDDSSIYEAAIQRQPMNVTIVDTWQFLTMDIHRQVKPYFTVMENGRVGRKYVVLTRRDSGLTNLAALHGKDILQTEYASLGVGKIWFKPRLLSEKLGTPETFFNQVEVVVKPTAAILPVFFGKKSACMVDDGSFDLMKELNPQVGQVLQVVTISDTYADVVVCLREGNWASAKLKDDTITSLKELHQDPAGQQICTLFKIDCMIPFEDSQLDTVRKLRATYIALQPEVKP
jgi:phosphonate transport system substrate-binding protein